MFLVAFAEADTHLKDIKSQDMSKEASKILELFIEKCNFLKKVDQSVV